MALRRLDEFVVWVPALGHMEPGDWERNEYSPPGFMARFGAPYFEPRAWEQLRACLEDVPEISELPPLSSREAVRALQWSAPRRILGMYPAKPQLHASLIATRSRSLSRLRLRQSSETFDRPTGVADS